MEGKAVILSVFIMSLVMVQVQVEAKTCCPIGGNRIYMQCRLLGDPREYCLRISGCIIIDGDTCPILENSGKLNIKALQENMDIAQIQVEAKICCPTTASTNIYNQCRLVGNSQEYCATFVGCKIIDGDTCPILENSGDDVNKYCNLGCASSVCGALTTLEYSDASEIVNEALEKCTNTCSTLCSKSSKTTTDQIA